MKKVLFLIHDLGQGGAEKVLVNLVNNMDYNKYDITIIALFGGGVNERFLSNKVTYKSIFPKMFPGNSKIMKCFSPEALHRLFVKEEYDVEISYLEGPSARIISGCKNKKTKLVTWVHVGQGSKKVFSQSFRSINETVLCYRKFEKIICVSEGVKNDFLELAGERMPCEVIYNTVESEQIRKLSNSKADIKIDNNTLNMIAVGTLKESKGYERLLRIIKKLKENNYQIKLYILGVGSLQKRMEQYIRENKLEDEVFLLGYDDNPYKYISKCDLFVCASYSEGFSTAATEALIVGTPICTVDVSGMKEMLGENNEYGIVTENNEQALYEGIKLFLDNPDVLEKYKKKAIVRGMKFDTKETVNAVEDMLERL